MASLTGPSLPGEREHGPVVVGVLGAVEEGHAGQGRDCVGQFVHDVLAAPLAEVRDALEEPGHALLPFEGSCLVASVASPAEARAGRVVGAELEGRPRERR